MRIKSVGAVLILLLLAAAIGDLPAGLAQTAAGDVYVVQVDDRPDWLAEKYYDDVQAYPLIVAATNARAATDGSFAVIDDSEKIEVGQKLWIPADDPGQAQAALAEPGAAGLGDPLYPGLGNGGYDATHYTVDLVVDLPANVISGTTTIEAVASETLSSFNLDLAGLEIDRVQVDGAPAGFNRAGNELTIIPAAALAEGQAFVAAISYHGTPQPVADPAVSFTRLGWLRGENGIYVTSEPSGAMSWYPANNHPLDKASYTFRISVARPYVVAANGLLEAEIDRGEMVTYVWQMADPMASYLATVNIGEYVRVEETGPDGLLIRNYFPVGDEKQLSAAFSQTAEMIDYFSDLLGPYPFDAYGVIVVEDNLGYALETQTLSVFGATSAHEPTIAHELMHQWVGNSVSPATWQDIWLNEGFAQYFTMLWLEHEQGREALEEQMAAYYRQLEARQIGPPAKVQVEEMFGPAVYFRGAWTLHALRLEVGDETFFAILRSYYERFAYGNANTADFIAVANEVSGRDLSEFLNSWLYEEALPPAPDN